MTESGHARKIKRSFIRRYEACIRANTVENSNAINVFENSHLFCSNLLYFLVLVNLLVMQLILFAKLQFNK